MQQRTEILKMLYRDNEILIFDEPTAVLTVQEIAELMRIMKGLAAEGKSILFITHKLNEIMEVADRCTILRKGKYIDTVNVKDTTPEELSAMMVGRNISFKVEKTPAKPGKVVLDVKGMTVAGENHKKDAVKNVSFQVRDGEIVCIAGIDGNGQKGVYPALKVDVVDTTGAGDAFFAGVCIGLTYGKSLREACGIGTRLASTVICTSENICPRFMPEEFGLAR